MVIIIILPWTMVLMDEKSILLLSDKKKDILRDVLKKSNLDKLPSR
jgi:hypothetical protein